METIDDLIRQCKIQLGIQLKNKRKIYLDLNYWIRMRECYVGSPKNFAFQKLYEVLIDLVNEELVVCPISQRIYIELLKQDDLNSRINTAKIIDKFSQGITILSEPEREQSELFYYVRKIILGQNNIIPVDEFIWLKVAYILGVFIPEIDNIPKDILDKMQKDIFNKSLEVTLEEIITTIGDKIPKEILNKDKSTIAMNLGKMLANDKVHSIKQVFMDEVRGALSIFKDTVEDFLLYLKYNNPSLLEELLKKEINNANDLLYVIFNDIKNDTLYDLLPFIYIQLCLHTMMRWDKNRSFTPNDLEDFLHAASALPYFDYFFTEKPLTLLLKTSQFRLDKKYNKEVLYDVNEIIESLNKIAS